MIRLDLIKQSVASAPGTGAISLGTASTGYIGIQDHPDTTDGMVLEYIAIDGNNKEFGICTYSATGDILTRTWIQGKIESGVYSKNPGTGVNLTANTIIQCGPVATNMNFKGCLVYKTSAQTISTDSWTNVLWDAEQYDQFGLHSTVTNTDRIYFPAGTTKIQLIGNVAFDTNATGVRAARFQVDDADLIGQGFSRIPTASGISTIINITSAVLEVADTSYATMSVYQTTGSNLNVPAGNLSSFCLRVIE